MSKNGGQVTRTAKAITTQLLPDTFWAFPSCAETTLKTKDLRQTLLACDGKIIAKGRLWNICSKRIGPGVYRVWLVGEK